MARQQGARARFVSGQWEGLQTWQLMGLIPFYVPLYAGRELLRHRGTILASTLAFVTALSLVPLVSVGASVLAGLNLLDKEGGELQPYLQRLFPASAPEIAEQLDAFAANGAADVAGVGTLAFLIIGIFLFVAIERVFNTLWSSQRERPWLQKSFAFVTLMTFGPALALASFTISARAHFRASQFSIDPTVLDLVLPFGLGVVLFTAMNHFLPTGRVRWWASLFAGVFTAVSFELVKWGFNLYITEIVLVPYSQAYGTLGLFPLFLVWLYLTWIIVLAGAALAHVSQHLRTLVTIEAAQQRSQGLDHVFNPLVALELYAPIARAFKTGERRVSEKDLLKRTGYSEAVVRSVVAQLESIGALDVVEDDAGERRLLPAKQLDDIKLLPIVDSFFDFEQPANSRPMAKLLQGYRAVTLEVLRSEDALSLIPQDDEPGQRYAQMKPWDPLPSSTLAGAPAVDDDPFESPPVANDQPRGSAGPEEHPASPAESGRAAESTDGIRISTRDILVEKLAGGTSATQGDTPRLAARKKRPSIEIDMVGMWDDFEADNYDEILQATEDELRRTEELDASEVLEIGAEKSAPPPFPRNPKD